MRLASWTFEVAIAVVVVVMCCAARTTVAQSPIFHLSATKFTTTNASVTTATTVEVRCEHDSAFVSKWTAAPGLAAGDALSNGTLYNSTTVGLEYTFGGDFSPFSASNAECIARMTVEGKVRQVPSERNCSVSRAELAGDLSRERCCVVNWDDGVQLVYCLVARTTPGYACTLDAQCHGGDCRGGYCCGALGRVPGCTACASGNGGGYCAACASPYFLVKDSARRRRRSAMVDSQNTFLRTRVLPDDSAATTTLAPATDDYDLGSLTANTCYRDQPAGAGCERNQECASMQCSGGFCCDDSKYSSACTNCTADGGVCGGCEYGYELNEGACTFLNVNGAVCAADTDCATGVCRGGKCCGPKGRSKGCLACDFDGECATCDTGYINILSECFKDTSTNGGGSTDGSSNSTYANSTIIAASVAGGVAFIMVLMVAIRCIVAKRTNSDE
ncbi:hypothetical protein PTSG_06630 [Salpingoeca rosetta]|uniref:Uncharacterized protein n=1 Tax=Salpingoeca rosetta (strain ATCC 50818 / BSB-021) TaxID=946362 RepID=F2UFJ2_SALR5|nr:uncharacterized protein PTSG_06630 [Salpingoeca rosetta]EGD75560.1 hypothetical protein PTSG_06630 [Salpingoeca rosetta]|eukprot:XP_004992017.1 hypothetical protein PTSG_06630 [Salpingoeca rosetta]